MAAEKEKIITEKTKKNLILHLLLVLIIFPLFLEIFPSGSFSDRSLGFELLHLCFEKTQNTQDYIEFLNIGQGDSTLIKSGDSAVLIDFGLKSDNNKIYNSLLKRGIKRLELAVITHHHSDHMGDFLSLAENIKINRLIINNTTAEDGENELYQKVITTAIKNGTEIILPKTGSVFKFGNATLEILSVDRLAAEENKRSVNMMVNICGKNILFTGDSDAETEQSLIKSSNIKCDILKLGHHGSAGSSYTEFLKAAAPKFAVASCGYDNLYNHPSADAVRRAEELGIKVLRTDLDRNIKVEFNIEENNYSVTTERGTLYADIR